MLHLPRRRYAIFTSLIYGDYVIVVYGDDIERAEKWGNFISWMGPVRPPIQIKKKSRTR